MVKAQATGRVPGYAPRSLHGVGRIANPPISGWNGLAVGVGPRLAMLSAAHQYGRSPPGRPHGTSQARRQGYADPRQDALQGASGERLHPEPDPRPLDRADRPRHQGPEGRPGAAPHRGRGPAGRGVAGGAVGASRPAAPAPGAARSGRRQAMAPFPFPGTPDATEPSLTPPVAASSLA